MLNTFNILTVLKAVFITL